LRAASRCAGRGDARGEADEGHGRHDKGEGVRATRTSVQGIASDDGAIFIERLGGGEDLSRM
jgi:hypothetical protein